MIKKEMAQVAGIYYPAMQKRELKNGIDYTFSFDNGKELEIKVEGLSEHKFLYADEEELIVRKKDETISISYDDGKSWKKELTFEGFKIFQVYKLSNGHYLVGGLEDLTHSYVYLLDNNLNILTKNQLGSMCWHAQTAIDEKDGILMFIEYQNFEKGAKLPNDISIFRSKDYGYSWEKVYTLSSPDMIRHGHTLQSDPYIKGHWIATSGDTAEQSKWFKTKDDGNTWIEVTDMSYVLKENVKKSLSAHRTTTFNIEKDYYYFSTDDLMGTVLDYFKVENGIRKSSSKFYRADKTEPIKLEKLSNIGIHGRCMVDIGLGYIFITEAKYVAYNSQVFYVDKENLTKVYFLFDLLGSIRHAGPASICSPFLKNNIFYTVTAKKQFLVSEFQALKWSLSIKKEEFTSIVYNIEHYVKFEEHLWFLNKTNSIKNIGFSDNCVKIELNQKKNIFYLMLGDFEPSRLLSKELFKLDEEKEFVYISFELEKKYDVSVSLYLEFYDDKGKISSVSHPSKVGKNKITFKKEKDYLYIKLLFRIASNRVDELELSNLEIKTTNEIVQENIEVSNNNFSTLSSLDSPQIAGIYYPAMQKRELKNGIDYTFSFDNGKELEIKVEGLSEHKFLYADEEELIVRKKDETISISYDDGKSWKKELTFEGFKIFQVYKLSNGHYLVGGLEDLTHSYVYLLDNNLNILTKNQLGSMCWHAQTAIDEKDGILMFIEYQNFEKGAKLPNDISIFRSKDYGYSWEKVYTFSSPKVIAHGCILQADPYEKSHWIATSGNSSAQSRWFKTKDNGESWREITDKSYILKENVKKSLSAHRTTTFNIEEDYYYFSTDDLMGQVLDYFQVENGIRKSSSKFYRASRTEPVKLECLTNLGINTKGMIDIGSGYIFITEAKYVAFNSQVFYVDKSNLTKVYFLFDLAGSTLHSGRVLNFSKFLKNNIFYSDVEDKMFLNRDFQMLKYSLFLKEGKQKNSFNIENYMKFEEHLWFLSKRTNIKNINFSNNHLKIRLIDKKDTFYLALGDYRSKRLLAKELFELDVDKELFKISFSTKKKYDTSLTLYIQCYNEDEMVSSRAYIVKNGLNEIVFQKEEKEKYIKLLYRISNKRDDEIEFSNLSIKAFNELNDMDITPLQSVGLEFISDKYGNKLKYRLNLSKEPKGLPLFVVLHGHGSVATRFQHEGWNVLAPHDNFGHEGKGVWWLGEDNNFFLRDLLQQLIKEVSDKYECKNNIYFYGSSMGGYGAIYHGILSNARAIYANVPQIVLHGSTYFNHYLKNHLKKVISPKKKLPIENNLIKFLESHQDKELPIFFLCENMMDAGVKAYDNYVQEQALAFSNKCIELNKKCHLELLPQSGHTKNYGLKEVLAKFERYAPVDNSTQTNEVKSDIDETSKLVSSDTKALKKQSTKADILEKIIPSKLFSFTGNESNLCDFKPRKDTKSFKLKCPLDWSIDPFSDRNWCFQLHAWRMMDKVLINYEKKRNDTVIMDCMKVMMDWKRYTIDEKQETKFTWYDMSTGLRALKLAYFGSKVFHSDMQINISDEERKTLLFLMKKHVAVLRRQRISPNNHGIFQVHGLLMLSWLLDDEKALNYALKEMEKLVEQQFYKDGFHVENSDKYHGFVLSAFSNILDFEVYKSDKFIQSMIKNAEDCMKWTVFPDNHALLIGDTDDKARNIVFEKEDSNEVLMKFFKDSGYFFIRSSFGVSKDKASMLFLQTAYKNNTHRHADDFNVLLYEYGVNILVDAGQHSYDYKSKERMYVVSTRAHNTLMIDDKNYKTEGKEFYSSALSFYDENDGVYTIKTSLYRKREKVEHSRIIIYKPKEFFIVIDKLDSKVLKKYTQLWHFHETLEIEKKNKGFSSKINKQIEMSINPLVIDLEKEDSSFETSSDLDLVKGKETPELQGWRSLKYRTIIENYAMSHTIHAKKALLLTSFLFAQNTQSDMNITLDKKLEKINCIIESKLYNIKLKIEL